jgi:hypothetical protein
VNDRAWILAVALSAVDCADLLPPPSPTTATIAVARDALGAAAVTADSVHVVVTRLSGVEMAEAGAPFTTDSVTIAFPLVLLDEVERFRLTLTLLTAGQLTLSETVSFTAYRGGSAQAVRFKPREWARGVGTGTQPSPREGAALAYVPGLAATLLTGGLDANGDSLNDAWRFTGDLWVALPPMPDFRRHHVVIPMAGDSAMIFGGLPDLLPPAVRIRTLIFDGQRWIPGSGPVTRNGSAGAFDVERDELVMFGGTSSDPANRGATTFIWRQFWRTLEVPGPSARVGHVMVYDPERRVVVLLGGESLEGTALNDVWLWRGEDDGWAPLVTYGDWPARSGHAAFYDPARGGIVTVGGRRAGALLDDIWELRDDVWAELMPVERPPPQVGPGAFDISRDLAVLVSGRDASGLVGDWWIYR